MGNGSFEADNLGFVFDFRRGGVASFPCSSADEAAGSSSSIIPGIFGGRETRGNCGDVGLVSISLRARGEGGVGGVSSGVLMPKDSRR